MRQYVIPKAEFKKQLRGVQKRHPKATYAETLEINRREQLQRKASPSVVKTVNTILHRAGLGLSRGLYMETPAGIVGGKMRYQWGKQLRYAGIGQERSSQHFDGEGFTDKTHSDGFLRAMRYADRHDLWSRPPGYYSNPRAGTYRLGDFTLTCAACGAFFVARKDSRTCSSKCRKRLSRRKTDVTLFKPNQ
jgi:hypothetical protein